MDGMSLKNVMSYCMNRFLQILKGAVYKNYVNPANLNGSQASCLKRKEDGNFARHREIHGESNVWCSSTIEKELST